MHSGSVAFPLAALGLQGIPVCRYRRTWRVSVAIFVSPRHTFFANFRVVKGHDVLLIETYPQGSFDGTILFDYSILMFSFKIYLYGWNCQSGQSTGAESRLRGWHSKCWVFLYKNWGQRPFHVRYQTKVCPCTAYQYMPTWHRHFYLVVDAVNFHFIFQARG